MTLYRSNNYAWTSYPAGHHYRCQGFIYNPYAEQPTPTPTGTKRSNFPWVLYANKLRNRASLTNYR